MTDHLASIAYVASEDIPLTVSCFSVSVNRGDLVKICGYR